MSDEFAVEFRNVSKAFGERKVLDDVSFGITEGEALCVLGRSGTGKSVTLKLMIGLLKADSGQVLVENEDITDFEEDDLSRIRRKIGFLFQSAALFDSFSVGDNLVLPLKRFGRDKSPEYIDKKVNDALKQVGLGSDRDKMPVALSGGMRKRAGLARALVLDPMLLLIDEPSSGLDRITSSEIDDLLMRVKKERKTTMVIVTHDVRGARRVGDKIAVLDKGRLVGFGTVEELEKSENEIVQQLISEQ